MVLPEVDPSRLKENSKSIYVQHLLLTIEGPRYLCGKVEFPPVLPYHTYTDKVISFSHSQKMYDTLLSVGVESWLMIAEYGEHASEPTSSDMEGIVSRACNMVAWDGQSVLPSEVVAQSHR